MEDFFINMDYWYQRNPGLLLLEQEQEALMPLLASATGEVLLQCGGPSDLSLVSSSPIVNRFYCGFEVLRSYAVADVVVADTEALPFVPGSIDAVVIAHLLSFVPNPQLLLQQIYLSLAPEGRLFVLGFNQRSLWGMTKWMTKHQGYPWCGQFYSINKVARWLRHMGYRIVEQTSLCFRPPVVDLATWQRYRFLEALGQMCCSNWGGVYLLVAQKRESTMTPLRGDEEQRSYSVQSGVPEVTAMRWPARKR